VDRSGLVALGLAAGALVLLGATLAALNAEIQGAESWGFGWRDTAVTAAAGAILLAVAGHLLSRRTLGLALILFLAATVTTAANKRFADRAAAAPRAMLADRVAQEMAAFDPSPAGDARRCALRAEFRAEHADSAFSLRRFDQSLDVASRQLAGRPFCAR
jgi:Ni,Fe-hydrogenase III component G